MRFYVTERVTRTINTEQASELLQVHPNTLRNWDKAGTLKAVRLGGRKLRRYKKSDLLKFLEQSRDN